MAKSGTYNTGKLIIPQNVYPTKHELRTAIFFIRLGKDVEFLSPVNRKGAKTPDIRMDGVLWEIKSPIGTGSRTLENAFRAALRQSPNVIFDLRRSKLQQQKCITELKKQFKLSGKIKRLIIIKKSRQSIALSR